MVGRVDQPVGRFGLARLLPSNRQAGEVSVVLWHDARLVTSKAGSWVGMELHLCAGRPTLNQREAAPQELRSRCQSTTALHSCLGASLRGRMRTYLKVTLSCDTTVFTRFPNWHTGGSFRGVCRRGRAAWSDLQPVGREALGGVGAQLHLLLLRTLSPPCWSISLPLTLNWLQTDVGLSLGKCVSITRFQPSFIPPQTILPNSSEKQEEACEGRGQ